MYEREISLFPAPAAGWSTLKLSTVGCQIFGKFQTAGSLFSCSTFLPLYQSSSYLEYSLPFVLP